MNVPKRSKKKSDVIEYNKEKYYNAYLDIFLVVLHCVLSHCFKTIGATFGVQDQTGKTG